MFMIDIVKVKVKVKVMGRQTTSQRLISRKTPSRHQKKKRKRKLNDNSRTVKYWTGLLTIHQLLLPMLVFTTRVTHVFSRSRSRPVPLLVRELEVADSNIKKQT
jgi:hypothetical protein